MTSKWMKNVGTESNPVSYLHEYAVALVWEELDQGLHKNSQVRVRTSTGDLSDNLLKGVNRIAVPDSLTPIGGFIPDIALFEESERPIRVVEVVVTSGPSDSKIEDLKKRGVDVVIVSVSDEHDLKDLCWTPANVSFAQDMRVAAARNWSASMHAVSERQYRENKQIEQLCRAIQSCSPEMRRKLLHVLRNIDTLDSLSPLSKHNPKLDVLQGTEVQINGMIGPRPGSEISQESVAGC